MIKNPKSVVLSMADRLHALNAPPDSGGSYGGSSTGQGSASSEPAEDGSWELGHDIGDRHHEEKHEATQASSDQDQQLHLLLGELRRDIGELRELQHERSERRSAAHEQELHGMLAELRRDITSLRAAKPPPAASSREIELQAFLAELRSDIAALRSEEVEPDWRERAAWASHKATPAARGPSGWSVGKLLLLAVPMGVLGGIVGVLGIMVLTGRISLDAVGRGSSPAFNRHDSETGALLPGASSDQLIESAKALIRKGDIALARRVLGTAMAEGNLTATLMLGETYDPVVLAGTFNPSGVAADIDMARSLYRMAAQAGSKAAANRLSALERAGR